MTRTSPSPITIDDEVVSLARRYRAEAVASLVTVLRDENAPASSKAQASATLLAYSDGKPGQARQISVADVSSMTDELRQELLNALLTHYEVEMPGWTKQIMSACIDEALAQASSPKPNRFKRGKLAGAGPEVPRWPPGRRLAGEAPALKPPASPLRAGCSAESAPADGCLPEAPPDAASPVFRGTGDLAEDPPALHKADDDPPAMRLAGERPDNVRQLPGTRREPALASTLSHEVERPPAFGIIYGTAETLEHSQASAPNPHGGIHPSVVERSALEDPLGPFDPWRRS